MDALEVTSVKLKNCVSVFEQIKSYSN